MNLYYTKMESPIGLLHLMATDKNLIAVIFDKNWTDYSKNFVYTPKKNSVLRSTVKQLQEYFLGKRTYFDLPIDFVGTDFQVKVWKSLLTVPFGKTISYSEQAQRIKKPKAVRCVGTTNGKNPISIIVPCHRVIGKNGSLTGYGGGLDIKKNLLELEERVINEN